MNGVRRSRLAVRTCPECTAETLVSNGAFWMCSSCRYAVTSMALAIDRTATEASLRSQERSPSRSTQDRISPAEDRVEVEPAWSVR